MSAYGIPPAALPAWHQLRAALADLADAGDTTPCQSDHADLWTSDDAEEREAAAWRCQPCPARDACHTYASEAGERWHVWAGIDREATRKARAA